MLPQGYWSIEACWQQARVRAYEPLRVEVESFALALASFYNDRHNAAMMTNTQLFAAADVVEIYDASRARGDRPFLLELDGVLLGDADFRHIEESDAEFAILIGPHSQQNRGYGTRCAALLHVAAARVFCFKRVYAAVIPRNVPSRRLLEKLGYRVDESARARRFAEADDDVVLSLELAEFERTHAELLNRAVIACRAP